MNLDMKQELKNWWTLRTSVDAAIRKMAIQMESRHNGCDAYAMKQVGSICELTKKDWRTILGLKELFLRNNNNLSSLLAEIGNLQKLECLDLYNNNLTTLPAEIGNLQGLKRLYLYNNNLTSLPAEIGKLQGLRELNLRNNNLSSLPAEIGKLQALKWLDLRNNNLTSLPAEIGNLKGLGRLKLRKNLISASEQQRIKSLLPNCEVYF